MTVIKGNKLHNYPKPGSAVTSDTESLHLGSVSASDTESVTNEPHTTIATSRAVARRQANINPSQIEELINLKKSCGRKKLRRYLNRCVLQTLNEEEEENDFVIIMESYKSPFARLLEDECAMKYWNNFIEKSEEEQTLIVRAFSEKYKNTNCDEENNVQNKGRLPDVVKDCEKDLLSFFKDSPDEMIVKCPSTSFDRLLLHAISQYHGLKSTNVLADDGSSKRFVEIHKDKNNWNPADCFLTDFIQQLRS